MSKTPHKGKAQSAAKRVLSPPKLSTPLAELHPDAATAFDDSYLVEFLDLPSAHSEAELARASVEFASDLNPVAVLITKALIEIPPKFAGMPPVNPEGRGGRAKGKGQKKLKGTAVWQGAQGLAEDVRYYGKWMRDEAEKRIGHLYPKVKITEELAKNRPDLKQYAGQELTVIAWLWARTVASPNPAAGGAHVPLVRSFWLGTKKGKEAWIQPVVERRNNVTVHDLCGQPLVRHLGEQ